MRCFRKTVRRSIDNAQPMLELFYVTSYQCIDQCIFATNNNAPNVNFLLQFFMKFSFASISELSACVFKDILIRNHGGRNWQQVAIR